MGFKADVILWDFATHNMMARFSLHKVKVQALAFSPNDLYLATLGGRDDGTIVMWNIEKLVNIHSRLRLIGPPVNLVNVFYDLWNGITAWFAIFSFKWVKTRSEVTQ